VKATWLNGNRVPPPVIRLAFGGSVDKMGIAAGCDLHLLVSYIYLDEFQGMRDKFSFKTWSLDSGAFSAWSLGKVIKLADYIECCKKLMATDPTLVEIFALDVINDWKAGLKNTEKMWKAGVPAIPCFHVGEPEHVLKSLARDYDKIALGGVAKRQGISASGRRFAQQCFARVWPKKIHGFGIGGESDIMSLPWHSVDSTTWIARPQRFGVWQAFGNKSLKIRGCSKMLRVQIEYLLKLQARARDRWRKEMALIDKQAA